MSSTWSLAVLPAGVEDAIRLAGGVEATAQAARAAAVEALLAAAGEAREAEYRLEYAGNSIVVSMGLDDDAGPMSLRDALDSMALPT